MIDCILSSRREVKHLLPATVLKLKSVRPQVWTTTVHEKLYSSVETLTTMEAKIKFLGKHCPILSRLKCVMHDLDLIQTWPLFGMTFFTVQVFDFHY